MQVSSEPGVSFRPQPNRAPVPAAPTSADRREPSTGPAPAAAKPGAGLDRLIKLLVLALVVAVVGFSIYYYADRQAETAPSLADRAVEQAEQAVRSDPGDLTARVSLGGAYLMRARDTEAITQFSTVLQVDPSFLDARRGLGIAYLRQGKPELAIPDFQQIIEARRGGEFAGVDKPLQEAYYFLASAQVKLQQHDAAIDSAQHALTIDKTDADAWQVLAQACLAAGRTDEARDAAVTVVKFAPQSGDAYDLLAQIYRAQGNQPGVQYAHGMIAYAAGNYEQAIKELSAATNAKPDLWEAWTGLGLTYEARLQKTEAAQAYHQALTGNPDDYSARLGLYRLGVLRP